jgi:hypothetical protein
MNGDALLASSINSQLPSLRCSKLVFPELAIL